MQYGNPEIRYIISNMGRGFKSYYVVWKLSFHFISKHAAKCLNRTMQYGNELITKKIYEKISV